MSTVARMLALPLSVLYGRAAAYRRRRYAEGRTRSRRLARPVVSVGNLTVGGTGKTPMVVLLAHRLCDAGLRVSVLSRGYGGRRERDPMVVDPRQGAWREVGDEPLLIARSELRARVTVGRSRFQAGLLAESLGPVDLHLLDDGFQHLDLARDADIVMVAASVPILPARCLPAGPYREPPEALAVASTVVVKTADGRIPPDLEARLRALGVRGAILRGRLVPTALRLLGGSEGGEGLAFLAARRVAAFAGIAEPQAFVALLQGLGADVVLSRAFPDHHPFRGGDVAHLAAEAKSRGADLLVCTAKDAVRLDPAAGALPIYELGVALEVEGIDGLVERLAALGRQGTAG